MNHKINILLGLSAFIFQSHSACPRISNNEIPLGSAPSGLVKRLNTTSTTANTIFFCKESRPASDTQLTFSPQDFIGNASGTDTISLGDTSLTTSIGTSSVTLNNSNQVGPYTLNEQNIDILATRPATWNERTLFHFYKRISSLGICTWNRHKSIRDYLRNNPSAFVLSNNNSPVRDTTHPWSIAKLDNAKLTKPNGATIYADIAFYWLQNKNRGGGRGTGGSWRSSIYRFCHFAVAVEFKLKTNFHGSAYDINEAGNYSVKVGIRTQN